MVGFLEDGFSAAERLVRRKALLVGPMTFGIASHAARAEDLSFLYGKNRAVAGLDVSHAYRLEYL